jgi:hypothetical protein
MSARAAVLVVASSLTLACLSWATSASAYHVKGNERIDYTAYTLNGGEVSLGPGKAQLGIIDELTAGTYVPAWFAFTVLDAPVPNGFLKFRAPLEGDLALSLRVNGMYIDADTLANRYIQNSGGDASLFVFPLEAAASYRLNRRFTQSVEATYVLVAAEGGEETDADIRGAAVMSNLTLSTLSELRLTRVFALTLLVRAMVYRGHARMESQFTEGSTSVDATLGAEKPYHGLVACAVPGASFSFSHVNFHFGVGYGNAWLPIVQLPLPDYGLVPEADFSVRF